MNNFPDSFQIFVGNRRTPEQTAVVRSPQQRAVVKSIVDNPLFDFMCDNPLSPEVGPGYTGPFMAVWYTTDGLMHFWRIGKTGRVLFSRTVTPS